MSTDSSIIPPRLHRGSRIGLFSPAGPVRDQERVDAGIKVLHDLGFKTRYSPDTDEHHAYLAASDKNRVDEFHAMLADDKIDALMAVRGGFGCLRIMNDIDFDLVRTHPKIIVGFSDVTVLLNSISSQTGLVTVHGPVVSSLGSCSRSTIQAFTALLSGVLPVYNDCKKIEILRKGKADGNLYGGNLTTITHLIGTPWDIPWDNTLLFLEDTGEPMYKVDRMLTQLFHAGKLNHLAGLILGFFSLHTREEEDKNADIRLREQVWNRVLELTADFKYPVWGGMPTGHCNMNYPLAIGGPATMESSSAKLILHNLFK